MNDSEIDQISKLIHDTPEGQVVYLVNLPNGTDMGASVMLFEEFCELTKDSSRFFIITTSIRTGWAYFMRHLELKHFPPMSKKNNALITFNFKWKGIPFSCCTVPKVFHSDIVDSLNVTNMKPVYGGVPTTVEATGLIPMPICADNCITVENGEDHIVYNNDSIAAIEWENEKIRELETECGV
jgi:hypothetical protein